MEVGFRYLVVGAPVSALKPGFHLGIPAAAYHADPCESPSLSSGIAKILLGESPRKAWHSHPKLNPDFVESEDSSKFDRGTAAHALLLEGDDVMAVVGAADWRTKAAQEQREAARAEGRIPVLAYQAEAVRAMAKAARTFIQFTRYGDVWENADSEVTAVCVDAGELRPVMLRCRFDRLARNKLVAFDYKSTDTSVAPDQFSRQMLRMGYHLQEAFYRRVAAKLGYPSLDFIFLAQSTEPPFECSLHACSAALQEIADAEIERAVSRWRRCLSTSTWPTHSTEVHVAQPTNWMLTDHETKALEKEAA